MKLHPSRHSRTISARRTPSAVCPHPASAPEGPARHSHARPACGSMHFGLYAFDLFEVIYDEHGRSRTTTTKNGSSANRSRRSRPLLGRSPTRPPSRPCAAPDHRAQHPRHRHRPPLRPDCRALPVAARPTLLAACRDCVQWTVLKSDVRTCLRRAHARRGDMRREFTGGLTPRVLGQLVDTVFERWGSLATLGRCSDRGGDQALRRCGQSTVCFGTATATGRGWLPSRHGAKASINAV